jgi:choline dehydrogenase-like flavoprotein
MIDASSETPLPAAPCGDIDGFRRAPSRWEVQFSHNLSGLDPAGDQSPKLTTPLAREVLANFATTMGLQVRDFIALGSLSQGGLSNIWGAVATVYDDEDLAGFPIRQADLLPSYASVMQRIGVSGCAGAAGLPVEEGPTLTAPAERLLNTAFRSPARDGGFVLERTTNAVLMGNRSGREGCARCGMCLWGCRRNSIYVSGLELPQLCRFPHFRYCRATLVRRLLPHDMGHALEIDGKTGCTLLPAPRVLLAAGTIATTSLVLRRLGSIRSTRLLTNPVGGMAFMIPALFAEPLPKRSFALGQLSYRFPLRDGGQAAGIIYGADALPLAGIAARLPISRPAALRLTRALAPSLLLATCYLPGRFSANTLRVAGEGDQRQILIEGVQTDATRHTLLAAGRRLVREMRRLGAFALPGSLRIAQPGADAHYAGTLPMGGNGPAACAPTGELNGSPGLYIADGAVLPDLPAKHCTLTIMANADRIARHLATRIVSERYR